MDYIIAQIENLYQVIQLKEFRKTPGVSFDVMTKTMVPRVDAIDRVIHDAGALSPGPVGEVARPWYMHTHQADNLFVLYGQRTIEIYTPAHGRVETFEVTPEYVDHNGRRLYTGAAVLVWPVGVFHRIQSGAGGSASINLATHYEGFNIETNFNIYDLDTATGEYRLIREGFKDQKTGEGQ